MPPSPSPNASSTWQARERGIELQEASAAANSSSVTRLQLDAVKVVTPRPHAVFFLLVIGDALEDLLRQGDFVAVRVRSSVADKRFVAADRRCGRRSEAGVCVV